MANISLGKVKTKQQFFVANVIQSGILGMDFLQQHGGILDFKNGFLMFENGKVKLLQDSNELNLRCCKVISYKDWYPLNRITVAVTEKYVCSYR